MKKYKTIRSKIIFKNKFMSLTEDDIVPISLGKRKISRATKISRFYRFDFSDWVNVIAIDKNDKILMIKQWRHGISKFTYEIPGGTMDVGEKNPLKAAKRELAEETGYTSKQWIKLGTCHPNPAVQKNKMHFFLALDAEKTCEVNFDDDEDIDTYLFSKPRVKEMLAQGKITHSLAALCLSNYFLFETKKTL